MQDENMILVPLSEYRELVEDAQRGKVLAEAFMANMRKTEYGVDLNNYALSSVFHAVFPEDYQIWEEEQKKKREDETMKEAEQ